MVDYLVIWAKNKIVRVSLNLVTTLMTFVDLSGLEKDILCDTNLKRISHFDSNSVYLKIIFIIILN